MGALPVEREQEHLEQQRSAPTPAEPRGAEAHAIPLLVANTLSHCRSTAAAGGMLEKMMLRPAGISHTSQEPPNRWEVGGEMSPLLLWVLEQMHPPGTEGVQGKNPNKSMAGHTIHISQ